MSFSEKQVKLFDRGNLVRCMGIHLLVLFESHLPFRFVFDAELEVLVLFSNILSLLEVTYLSFYFLGLTSTAPPNYQHEDLSFSKYLLTLFEVPENFNNVLRFYKNKTIVEILRKKHKYRMKSSFQQHKTEIQKKGK